MISLRQSIINEASKTDLGGVYPIPPKTLPSNSAFITLIGNVSTYVNKYSHKDRGLFHYSYNAAFRGFRYKIVTIKNQPNSKVDCLRLDEVPTNFFFIGTTDNNLLGKGGQIKNDKIMNTDNVICGHYNVKRKEVSYIDCSSIEEMTPENLDYYSTSKHEKYINLDRVERLYTEQIEKSVIDALNKITDDIGTNERVLYWNIIFYGSGAPQSAELFYDSLEK